MEIRHAGSIANLTMNSFNRFLTIVLNTELIDLGPGLDPDECGWSTHQRLDARKPMSRLPLLPISDCICGLYVSNNYGLDSYLQTRQEEFDADNYIPRSELT